MEVFFQLNYREDSIKFPKKSPCLHSIRALHSLSYARFPSNNNIKYAELSTLKKLKAKKETCIPSDASAKERENRWTVF